MPNLDHPLSADRQAVPSGPRIDAQVAAAVVDFIHAKAAELLAQLLAVDRTLEWCRRGLVPPARVGQRPRRSRRHEVHTPAWLYVGSRVWRAEVLNVSEGGLLLLCPVAPTAADADIRFLLEEGRGGLEVILGETESSAEVRIRHARACDGGVQLGLQMRPPWRPGRCSSGRRRAPGVVRRAAPADRRLGARWCGLTIGDCRDLTIGDRHDLTLMDFK